MANTIIVKRSSVAGKVPAAGDLQIGELAVNLTDRKIYSKDSGGNVVQLGGGAGSGDVVGPASSTDNALVRFDGTTGKLVQNSLGILDDSGNLDVTSAKADYFDLDIAAAAPASAVGREAWDDGAGTSILGLKGGVVTYYYGQQTFARVYNGSGAAMSKGQVVYIVGAQGNRIDVRLALATSDATSANTIGLVAEPIAAGAEGWVQTSGPMPKLDTSTLTAGQAIYLSPTTAGAYTTTKPVAPNHLVVLGFVERVSATVGSIYLKVDNGYELDELHNVNITSPTSGNTLIYDAVAGVWENANLTAGTGISVTNGAGSITIANTGVTSITGTANEVDVSASTGGVTISLPATINANTTGVAANVSGTVAVANGGTGATTAAAALTNLGAYPATNPNGYTSNTGTVTSVASGTGLTGGPITTTGTLSLANTTVTPGSYTYSSITVDAQGRITAASSGSAPQAFPSGTAMIFAQTAAPTGWTKSVTHNDKALRVVSGTAGSGGSVAFSTAFASQTPSGTVGSTTATGSLDTVTATGTNSSTAVSGTIGSTTATGSVSVSGTVSGTTLAESQIPSHRHYVMNNANVTVLWPPPTNISTTNYLAGSGVNRGYENYVLTATGTDSNVGLSSATGGGGSHTHGFSGSGSFSGTAHDHTFTGGSHTHTFTGTGHTHTFTGTAHNHTFTGNAINLAVQYVDVIIATKD